MHNKEKNKKNGAFSYFHTVRFIDISHEMHKTYSLFDSITKY